MNSLFSACRILFVLIQSSRQLTNDALEDIKNVQKRMHIEHEPSKTKNGQVANVCTSADTIDLSKQKRHLAVTLENNAIITGKLSIFNHEMLVFLNNPEFSTDIKCISL